MKEKTIRNILGENSEKLEEETFSFQFDGGAVKFVERIPLEASVDEYWLVVSVVQETSGGGVETFWKIPGIKYDDDYIELEERNAFEVTRGEECEVPVWVDTKEKLSESILYPLLGYFWHKFGNNQYSVAQHEKSGKSLTIKDFGIEFKVIDTKEAGYDEGSSAYATLEINHGGQTVYLKIGGVYDSTEGFYWCPEDVTVVKKEMRVVHEWKEVK